VRVEIYSISGSTKSVTHSFITLFGGFIVSQDEFRAPAGWYPDPLGLPQLRWWNNHGWTEQVSAAPEPLVMQQAPRFAWKEDEPQVIPVQQQAARTPTPPQAPVSATLNELEAPRAQAKVDEPSSYESWQSAAAVPVSQVFPPAPTSPVAAAIPVAPAEPVAQTPPPPYWDADDDSTPAPSVRPKDLKFWPGTSPAELRRMVREQAARDNQH
jgi:hypothetical protein